MQNSQDKRYYVYDAQGDSLLLDTTNFLKARGFASVRGLKVSHAKKESSIDQNPINFGIAKFIDNAVGDKRDEAEDQSDKSIVDKTLEQQEKDNKALRKLGITPTKAVYDEGSELNETGKSNLLASKRTFDNLPSFKDGVKNIISTIKKEDRSISYSLLRNARMAENGRWTFDAGKTFYDIEDYALGKLLASFPMFPAFKRTYQYADTASLARFVNDQIVFRNKTGELDDIKIQLGIRQRKHHDSKSVYRVVSPTYTNFSGDMSLQSFLGFSEGTKDSKFIGHYDEKTTSYRAACMYHADHNTIGAGSVFKAGVEVKGDDRGTGAVLVNSVAFRNLCLNLIIIAVEKGRLARIIHKGQGHSLRLDGSLENAKETFSEFLAGWGKLENTQISSVKIWGKTFDSVVEALDWGVSKKKIGKDIADKALLENLLGGYMFERGDTLSAFINSITRAAHVYYKGDNQRQLELEGGLLTRELVFA